MSRAGQSLEHGPEQWVGVLITFILCVCCVIATTQISAGEEDESFKPQQRRMKMSINRRDKEICKLLPVWAEAETVGQIQGTHGIGQVETDNKEAYLRQPSSVCCKRCCFLLAPTDIPPLAQTAQSISNVWTRLTQMFSGCCMCEQANVEKLRI